MRNEGRYREAFGWFDRAVKLLPLDHGLYWIGWHEMFALGVAHLNGLSIFEVDFVREPVSVPNEKPMKGGP